MNSSTNPLLIITLTLAASASSVVAQATAYAEARAWLGVKFIQDPSNAVAKNYQCKQADPTQHKESTRDDSDNAHWLWPKADKPPVVFVGSREATHATLEDFTAYLADHRFTVADGLVTCTFEDDLGASTKLQLGGNLPAPLINDKPVNLQPRNVFESPYLQSDHGSGVVTITKGERKLTLDFTVNPLGSTTGAGMSKKSVNAKERAAFESADAATWQQVFADSCTGNWKDKWFLDGEVGKVTTGPDGMTLTAGPEFKNEAHHMVLWTKDSFEGDVKIEYDYTRLDNENRCVTILYIQATGSGDGAFATDITKWNDERRVPAMGTYYNNMNLYHISYAAFDNDGKATKSYIRGRRYMPQKTGLKGTDLEPDYYFDTLFATGVKHHITVIKKDRELLMRVENPDEVVFCRMVNTALPPVTEGRIGLRHMFTRSARYENIAISTPQEE